MGMLTISFGTPSPSNHSSSPTTRPDSNWKSLLPRQVEADTFFCFTRLAREMRSLFHCKEGLKKVLREMDRILSASDSKLHSHMQSMSPPLDSTFYCLPWLITLCSQGVMFEKVLVVWDVFLSGDRSTGKVLNMQFVICFCVALVRSLRKLLLASDFSGAMSVLHGALDSLNFQAEIVLSSARDLMKKVYPAVARNSSILKSPSTKRQPRRRAASTKKSITIPRAKSTKKSIEFIDGKPADIVSSGIAFESI